MLIGISRHANRALGPLLEFCRALPPPVVVPVAILLFGYGQSLKLFVMAWAAAWPILLNSASATRRRSMVSSFWWGPWDSCSTTDLRCSRDSSCGIGRRERTTPCDHGLPSAAVIFLLSFLGG